MGNLGEVFGGEGFDANTVEPAKDFSPIPSSEQLVVMDDSALRETNDKQGKYYDLRFQVIDGPFKGQKLWSRENVVNKNETTVKIAKQRMSAIAHAVGILNASDTQEYHDKPLVVKVEYVKANFDPKTGKGSKRDYNEIRAFKAVPEGFDASAIQAETTATPMSNAPPAAAGSAKPFWQKDAAA